MKNAGKISEKEQNEILAKITNPSIKHSQLEKLFEKKAGIASGAGKMLWGLTRDVGKAGWKGLNPRSGLLRGEKTPFLRKAWTGLTYGGLATGGLYGTSKLQQRLSTDVGPDHTKRSGANYTTFLRNNILSGDIQPSELNQRDLISVRRLGTK